MSVPSHHRWAAASGWLSGVQDHDAPVGQSYASYDEAREALERVQCKTARAWSTYRWTGRRWVRTPCPPRPDARQECPT